MDNFKSEIHNEIMREYEVIRAKNEAIYKNNKEQVYNHLPRLKEIDELLADLSLRACRKLLNSGTDHAEIMSDLQKNTEKLVKEKNKILNKAGIPSEFLDEIYNCPLCKDKGSYDNKWCECYYAKLQKFMQKKSNINTHKMNCFDKFNVSLYSDKVDEVFGVSPRDNAKEIYETALKYANLDESTSRQLLLYGKTGLGKTFTSDCIARVFIKKGKSVYYTSAPRLFTIFEDYKFGRNTTEEAKRIIDYISSVDLLIIDDLGTEFRTQYIDSILFDIINSRTNENKHMIISTNLEPAQIETAYSGRISSRIMGHFELLLFFGEDLRLIQNTGRN